MLDQILTESVTFHLLLFFLHLQVQTPVLNPLHILEHFLLLSPFQVNHFLIEKRFFLVTQVAFVFVFDFDLGFRPFCCKFLPFSIIRQEDLLRLFFYSGFCCLKLSFILRLHYFLLLHFLHCLLFCGLLVVSVTLSQSKIIDDRVNAAIGIVALLQEPVNLIRV